MFAMFHCGRPDVLPVGDLAVRKGFQTLYGLPAPPSVEQMEALSAPWRPFRSLGRYLPNMQEGLSVAWFSCSAAC